MPEPVCAHCGRPGVQEDKKRGIPPHPLIRVGYVSPTERVFLHARCWTAWREERDRLPFIDTWGFPAEEFRVPAKTKAEDAEDDLQF
jgi:hypothetical protein